MQYSLTENLSKFRPFGGGSRVNGQLILKNYLWLSFYSFFFDTALLQTLYDSGLKSEKSAILGSLICSLCASKSKLNVFQVFRTEQPQRNPPSE